MCLHSQWCLHFLHFTLFAMFQCTFLLFRRREEELRSTCPLLSPLPIFLFRLPHCRHSLITIPNLSLPHTPFYSTTPSTTPLPFSQFNPRKPNSNMGKKSPRMSKAKRLRLEEEAAIEADLRDLQEKRELVEKNNAHSDMLSRMMLDTGRLYNVDGLVSGDYQTAKYAETLCSNCGKHWSGFCPCTGRMHSESVERVESPWRVRSTLVSSPGCAEPKAKNSAKKKRSTTKRAKSVASIVSG